MVERDPAASNAEPRLCSRARFPDVPLSRPHYESFYLKATHPRGGLGIWLRHTVLKAPGERPRGSLWLTMFDRDAPGPVALKAAFPPEQLSAPDDAYIRIAAAVLGPGAAGGRLDAGKGGQASWELSFEGGEPPFAYLPRPWMYEAPVPRTKAVSLHPLATFSGSVATGGRTLELERWPGMVGHNWGSEHAYRSSWLHGAAFAEQPDAFLDAVVARVRLGPVLTPWIAAGCVRLDGRLHRLGGLSPRSTRFQHTATGARFRLRGDGIAVDGEVGAVAERFVAWRYGHPVGGWHPTLNCSIADMRLRVRLRLDEERMLTASGTAAYEIQLRPDAPTPVALQPFGDP
jgi:hypothetical protein